MLYSGEKTSEIFFFDFGLCKLLTNLNVRHVCHSTMIEELNKTFQEHLTSFATQKNVYSVVQSFPSIFLLI